MKNIKNYIKDLFKNNLKAKQQGGIIELLVLIVIALLLMKYYGVTISGVIYWFKSFFASVLR